MRPDEHKKKRSSAYKKKHGIGQNKDQNQDKIDRDKLASTAKGASKEQPVEHQEQKVDLKPQIQAFSKKPIQSNWDRYRPLSDDEEDLGTDYNVLLSFAGDASSHIKLKHEEEWEAESADFDVLAIDHKHLSQALMNIPFSEKYKLAELGVEPNVLQFISEIDDFEFQQKPNPVGTLASLSTSKSSDMGFNFSSIPKATKESVAQSTSHGLSMLTSTSDKNQGATEDSTPSSQAEANVRDQPECDEKLQQMPVCSDELKNEDDRMIDELLSSNQDRSKNPGKLISITASETTFDIQTKINEVNDEPTLQKEDGELGDLEDWLDSIL